MKYQIEIVQPNLDFIINKFKTSYKDIRMKCAEKDSKIITVAKEE